MYPAIAETRSGTATEQTSINDDKTLVLKTIDGDETAFETLVRRYKRMVVALIRRLTLNTEDAEDLTQQAFMKAFINLSTFRFSCSFSSWLVSIAINEARMWSRKHRRWREVQMMSAATQHQLPVPHDVPDHRQDVESHYLQRERMEFLWKELDRLPPATRAAFDLCDLKQLPTVDAAICLGVTVSALKSRRSRGRARLRRRLEPHLSGCCVAQKA